MGEEGDEVGMRGQVNPLVACPGGRVEQAEKQAVASVNAVLAEIGAAQIPQILVYNKIDAIEKSALARKFAALSKASGKKIFAISGVSGEGVNDVLRALVTEIVKKRNRGKPKHPEEVWTP